MSTGSLQHPLYHVNISPLFNWKLHSRGFCLLYECQKNVDHGDGDGDGDDDGADVDVDGDASVKGQDVA